jgi:hypothetical protein
VGPRSTFTPGSPPVPLDDADEPDDALDPLDDALDDALDPLDDALDEPPAPFVSPPPPQAPPPPTERTRTPSRVKSRLDRAENAVSCAGSMGLVLLTAPRVGVPLQVTIGNIDPVMGTSGAVNRSAKWRGGVE